MPRDPRTGRFVKAEPAVQRPAPEWWAWWPWARCTAFKPRVGFSDWGRCDRKKRHDGEHALARDVIIWF